MCIISDLMDTMKWCDKTLHNTEGGKHFFATGERLATPSTLPPGSAPGNIPNYKLSFQLHVFYNPTYTYVTTPPILMLQPHPQLRYNPTHTYVTISPTITLQSNPQLRYNLTHSYVTISPTFI